MTRDEALSIATKTKLRFRRYAMGMFIFDGKRRGLTVTIAVMREYVESGVEAGEPVPFDSLEFHQLAISDEGGEIYFGTR